jgi:hypothetical protein
MGRSRRKDLKGAGGVPMMLCRHHTYSSWLSYEGKYNNSDCCFSEGQTEAKEVKSCA